MDFGLQLLRLAGSLALVLALFFALMYGLKRWGRLVRKTPAQPAMEVVSKHSFGPRHHLLLVKVPGGGSVLVGISPQNMSVLSTSLDPANPGVPEAKVENL
ncbi:MAG: flagellar biosynthetic protein FliO [Syntrophobacteraceae bacterium]